MAKQKRALTPAETARKERFDALCREMAEAGYEKTDLTVGIVFANAASIFLMLPFAAALWVCYVLVNPSGRVDLSLGGALVFLVLLLLLTVVHEGIHGLTLGAFAKGHLRSISFGVIWTYLTPYCTCAEPLKRWQYVVGTAMPTLILGFGLGAAAVGLGQPMLFLLSVIMLFGGGGDALIILKVLFHRSGGRNAVYCDHPYDCGVVVFEQSSNIADKGA